MSASRINARFVFAALVAAFSTFLFGNTVIVASLLHLPRALMTRCSQFWARWILSAAGVTVRFEGLDHLPGGPAVLVGNHQGVFEILALIAYLPQTPVFVTKQEAFRIPVFGNAIRAFGHIAVDRENPEKAIASIQQGTEQLQARGDQVVFFPEGTRTRDGKLKPFKKGAFAFALQSGLPLIPFAVDGSYQALPPKQKLIHPGVVRIRFLAPIETAGLSFEHREQVRDLAFERISTAVDRLRQTQPLGNLSASGSPAD